jgi:hypothetical protein
LIQAEDHGDFEELAMEVEGQARPKLAAARDAPVEAHPDRERP